MTKKCKCILIGGNGTVVKAIDSQQHFVLFKTLYELLVCLGNVTNQTKSVQCCGKVSSCAVHVRAVRCVLMYICVAMYPMKLVFYCSVGRQCRYLF